MHKHNNIDRSTRLFAAQREGRDALHAAQSSISETIMGGEQLVADKACEIHRASIYGEMTAFDVTTEFANMLQRYIGTTDRRFDLRVCDASMFRAIWKARQMVDMTGINYRDYVQRAVTYLRHCGKKRITPAMLVSADVQLHVMELDLVSR
ncbi:MULTISPECIES: hypothetical protein [Stenotrophomonas]|uniref:hypothetical protein n=1 Tax=Stenotrophomonas TaxID=40323 RepID=UPI00129C8A40|nr:MULTISPECIES: hypothetical protein [unclassified Stenotrophomonas]MRI45256.1 hypothetical protein [Stenotrophomonas sp. MH181796]